MAQAMDATINARMMRNLFETLIGNSDIDLKHALSEYTCVIVPNNFSTPVKQ